MKFEGRVWKFGENVDTDFIVPGRFLNVSEERVLAQNCFADLRPDFVKDVRRGDIIVAGPNFGCGSSREHAPRAIRASGISLIIAVSFARIFYRNAFNIGLPVIECKEAFDTFSEGSLISVDLASGEIRDQKSGNFCTAKSVPVFMMKIIQAGGLVNYIKDKGIVQFCHA
jgi:3-isopropylmalate/(R)-2-methylmalate dehydratase small subunit